MSPTVTVVGRGIGLYGYLPALLEGGRRVVLPESYRERVRARDDIRWTESKLQWVASADEALARADAAVIAVPPAEQPRCVARCLALPNMGHLLVEKPLAPTPDEAAELLARLDAWGKPFRIGYAFGHTAWGEALARAGTGLESLEWTFRAHHYTNDVDTWKRRHAQGGGALRFYGIHAIALLADVGYDRVETSATVARLPGEVETWRARLGGPGLPPCSVVIASNSDEASFVVRGSSGEHHAEDPFEGGTLWPGIDRRAPLLGRLLDDLFLGARSVGDGYLATNDLWRRIEKKTAPP